MLSRTFVQQALDRGVAEADIHAMAAAWRQWAEAPDAWFLIPSVEILAKPGASAQPFRGRSPKR